ncbi:MAG: Hsp20 family protein [Myxococcales bacterium]|nr:Hsp20 family protein [Myxococcales bacterium]
MRTYDLTPLFRTSVGFDRMSRLMDSAMQLESTTTGYPPYNIVRVDEDSYRITLAVAGFAEEDLTIETHEGRLKVTGETRAQDEGVEFLHRGIAGRRFERTFQLADHIHVAGAELENGLLHVELERVVPEELKPRRIPIGSSTVEAELIAK